MITQLNPSIPMITARGNGFAFMVIDYSQEHDLLWVIALTATGEIWCVRNSEVRIEENYTFGRSKPTLI